MEGSKLGLKALEHTVLPDIDDVAPISKADEACLRELRAVLEKYYAVDRFGIALLHSHFPVADDEVLVELPDTETRTLVTRVLKREALEGKTVIETLWHLGVRGATRKCVKTCSWDRDKGKHKKTGHLPMLEGAAERRGERPSGVFVASGASEDPEVMGADIHTHGWPSGV